MLDDLELDKSFECPECNMVFKRESSLAAHFDMIHAPKINPDYQCPLCEFKVNHLGKFKLHLRQKHPGQSEQMLQEAIKSRFFICKYCSLKFRRLNTLHEHVANVHEGCKPYSCDICGAELLNLRYYKQHMAKHEKREPKYKCEVCGQEFQTQIPFFRHIRENHPKYHKCNICGAQFKKKENLVQHQQKHNSDPNSRKTYVCPIEGCKSSFTRKSNLQTHIKSIHGGVQPYSCEICGKDFLYPSLLEKHKKSHIKQEEPEVITLDESLFESIETESFK